MQDEKSIARLSFSLLAKENSGKWGGKQVDMKVALTVDTKI